MPAAIPHAPRRRLARQRTTEVHEQDTWDDQSQEPREDAKIGDYLGRRNDGEHTETAQRHSTQPRSLPFANRDDRMNVQSRDERADQREVEHGEQHSHSKASVSMSERGARPVAARTARSYGAITAAAKIVRTTTGSRDIGPAPCPRSGRRSADDPAGSNRPGSPAQSNVRARRDSRLGASPVDRVADVSSRGKAPS